MAKQSLSGRMAAAAREMQDQVDLVATVQSAVVLSVRNIDGCDAASVSIAHSKAGVETAAATDDMAVTGDQLQYLLGEGPCLDAIWEGDLVYVSDLEADPRWSAWGPRVAHVTSARSLMSVRLFTTHGTVGSLNMYSTKANGFTAEDRHEALALAAHIAVAVVAARNVEQFEKALDSRTIIGQACGLVMERFDIDAVRAFGLLTRLSSTENVKLRTLAAELVRTRLLPTPESGMDDNGTATDQRDRATTNLGKSGTRKRTA